MLCNFINKKIYWVFLIAIGIISLVFGVVSYQSLSEDAHDLSMLMGMFTGLGGTFIVIGTFRLVRMRFVSPQKLKQEEIDRKDERNIQILRIAYTISGIACTILFAAMAFLFVLLGYRVPAFISIGALYIQIIIFLLAYVYYKKKM